MRFIYAMLAFVGLSIGFAAEPATTPAATAAYPLTVCAVSGEELGSMGKPVEVVHEGTTVKLCCKGCIKKFNKDPAGYTAKVTAAAAADAKPAEAAAPETKPAE